MGQLCIIVGGGVAGGVVEPDEPEELDEPDAEEPEPEPVIELLPPPQPVSKTKLMMNTAKPTKMSRREYEDTGWCAKRAAGPNMDNTSQGR